MPKNALGSSLDVAATSGPGMPSPICRSSSLPTSTSTFSTMRAHGGLRLLGAAPEAPELGPVVEVEGDHRAGRLGRLHALDDGLARGRGERGEDAAAVEPAHAAREDRLPVEVAGLELRRRLVGAVVEHHGRAHALAPVAEDRGHVRAR